jgi:hypothetical protein
MQENWLAPVAANVSANNAVAFGAEKDAAEAAIKRQIPCGWSRKPTRAKSNGTNTTISFTEVQFSHIKKVSVVVCRVS